MCASASETKFDGRFRRIAAAEFSPDEIIFNAALTSLQRGDTTSFSDLQGGRYKYRPPLLDRATLDSAGTATQGGTTRCATTNAGPSMASDPSMRATACASRLPTSRDRRAIDSST